MAVRTSLALVAAALLGFWLGGQCGTPDADAIARADTLAAHLNSLEATHQRDSVANVVLSDSIRHTVQTVSRLRSQKHTVQTVTDSIVLRIPDSALVANLQKTLIAERAVSDSTVQALTVALRFTTDLWRGVTAERDNYRNLAITLNAELQSLVRKATRGRLRPCAFAGVGIQGVTVGVGACYSL